MFSDDGQSLFCGHESGVVRQLDIGQGHPIAEYKGLSRRVVSIGQTKDGRLVCGASSAGELVTWNALEPSDRNRSPQQCQSVASIKLSNVCLKNVFFTHKNRIVCVSTIE
jgi:WD40 repeat protein